MKTFLAKNAPVIAAILSFLAGMLTGTKLAPVAPVLQAAATAVQQTEEKPAEEKPAAPAVAEPAPAATPTPAP